MSATRCQKVSSTLNAIARRGRPRQKQNATSTTRLPFPPIHPNLRTPSLMGGGPLHPKAGGGAEPGRFPVNQMFNTEYMLHRVDPFLGVPTRTCSCRATHVHQKCRCACIVSGDIAGAARGRAARRRTVPASMKSPSTSTLRRSVALGRIAPRSDPRTGPPNQQHVRAYARLSAC